MSREKYNDKVELGDIATVVRSDAGVIKDYLYFIANQLIDIKYELKELKDIEKHGV